MPIPLRSAAGPLIAAGLLLLCATSARAQDAGALLITVPNPITSDGVKRIQNQTNARVHDPNPERRIRTVVLDFNPDGKPAFTSDFGPCYDLAEFISNLGKQGVVVIGFVNAKTTGHTVLPVLACKEVVMREKGGELGPVVTEGVPELDEVKRQAYRAKFGRPERFPIVQKMFDKNVALVRGPAKNGQGWVYADRNDQKALEQIAGVPEPVKGVQDGQYAAYQARTARDLDLVRGLADSRTQVAELYGLPPFREDPLQGRAPDAYQWTLKGDVDGAMRESVNRVIREVRKKKGNFLVLVFSNCGGTDFETARELAGDLVKAQEGEEALMIIAFIPENAPDAAAVIALGCTEIVMTKPTDGSSKEATFGNFDRFLASTKPEKVEAWRQSLRQFAAERNYPPVVIDALLDRNADLVRARGKDNNRNKTRLMTRDELKAAQDAGDDWTEEKVFKEKGVPLVLNATTAAELGIARFTVPGTAVKDVCAVYGAGDAKDVDPGWIERFAEFIRIPAVTIILVMIGFIGLVLELKVPGLTVPGIVAALCFILVFWAHSKFSGQMFVLALLLFILGLVLIGLEIFVLPGFGVCGICGILFMLGGLGLVTLEKAPSNTSEWIGFGLKVSQYLFAMMGAVVVAFLIARFLPQMPYANRLMLTPPADDQQTSAQVLPGASEAAELLGAIGTTSTTLKPAGVVRFGDKFVDVVSDGGFIEAGARVQVIAVEGTRIVVKEV